MKGTKAKLPFSKFGMREGGEETKSCVYIFIFAHHLAFPPTILRQNVCFFPFLPSAFVFLANYITPKKKEANGPSNFVIVGEEKIRREQRAA